MAGCVAPRPWKRSVRNHEPARKSRQCAEERPRSAHKVAPERRERGDCGPGIMWLEKEMMPCGPQKKDPSLCSLLHEPIFMMQAAEYGSFHNSVAERQTVSVLVGRNLVRHGLRQTGGPT